MGTWVSPQPPARGDRMKAHGARRPILANGDPRSTYDHATVLLMRRAQEILGLRRHGRDGQVSQTRSSRAPDPGLPRLHGPRSRKAPRSPWSPPATGIGWWTPWKRPATILTWPTPSRQKKSMGKTHKTDPIDARELALLLRTRQADAKHGITGRIRPSYLIEVSIANLLTLTRSCRSWAAFPCSSRRLSWCGSCLARLSYYRETASLDRHPNGTPSAASICARGATHQPGGYWRTCRSDSISAGQPSRN